MTDTIETMDQMHATATGTAGKVSFLAQAAVTDGSLVSILVSSPPAQNIVADKLTSAVSVTTNMSQRFGEHLVTCRLQTKANFVIVARRGKFRLTSSL